MHLFVLFYFNFKSNSRELPEALRFPLLIPNDVDRSSIPLPTVRGSLYEVDILDRECRAIYWKGIGICYISQLSKHFWNQQLLFLTAAQNFNLNVAINIVKCIIVAFEQMPLQ